MTDLEEEFRERLRDRFIPTTAVLGGVLPLAGYSFVVEDVTYITIDPQVHVEEPCGCVIVCCLNVNTLEHHVMYDSCRAHGKQMAAAQHAFVTSLKLATEEQQNRPALDVAVEFFQERIND